MKKKKNSYGNSLKWKVLLLIVGIIALVGLVVFQHETSGKKKQQESIEDTTVIQDGQQNETKEGEKQEEITGEEKIQEPDADTGEDVPESGTQEEGQSEQQVRIINLDEFATAVMGENAELLNERLTEWVEENRLNAGEGSIFHVMVPQSDPQSIQFYIRLSDERGSIVMLAYHPRENVVTASICNYTEEEIVNEVWEGNNGPAVRDVPPEQDTGGNVGQEGAVTDDITGEN